MMQDRDPSPPKKRVLFVSHGHPDLSPGGAEWAAYYMHQALKSNASYEPYLLALRRDLAGRHLGTGLERYGTDESVHLLSVDVRQFDVFYQTYLRGDLREARQVHESFRRLLSSLGPSIVHFHHYTQLGIEMLTYVKTLCPRARVVVTLHEYIPICAHKGAMIQRPSGQLCESAAPLKCCRCFPERSPVDFFLRERSFKTHFAAVDRFIASSDFLKERFSAWGLDPGRIVRMDNGRPLWPKPDKRVRRPEAPFTVGFFGQVVFHKGVDVLLKAAREYGRRRMSLGDRLPELRFQVHGSFQYLGQDDVRRTIEGLAEACRDFVEIRGAYDCRRMPTLLQGVDCVVMPSVWWENSPLVLQEAFMAGVPVICSDIGGMAEKVAHNQNGLHFRVGDHLDLLDRILELATDPELRKRLAEQMPVPLSDVGMARRIAELYDELLSEESDSSARRIEECS